MGRRLCSTLNCQRRQWLQTQNCYYSTPLSGKHLQPISSVQSLSCVWLFATPWTAEHQASLSITNFWSLLKFMFIKSVMPSNHIVLCHPLLLLPTSFSASGSFPVSQLFQSGTRSIGASASTSVFPMNIQDWSPLGWTGLISLQSKGLLSFSNTTIQKHQFFGAQLSLWSNSHIHTWLLENLNLTWSWNYISTIFVQAALVSTEGFIMSVTDFPFYREANKGESTQQRWAPVLTIYT